MTIEVFRGPYGFLSNFYTCRVKIGNLVFTSVEAGYQAAKIMDPEVRKTYQYMEASDAKRASWINPTRWDWTDEFKLIVMEDLVTQKFTPGTSLAKKLLTTGDELIIEGGQENRKHKDLFWGMHNGKGRNELGKILMIVRKKLKDTQKGQGVLNI